MAGLLPNIDQSTTQGRVRSANDFAPASGLGTQSLPASTPGMMSLGKGNVNTQGRTGGGGTFSLSQGAQQGGLLSPYRPVVAGSGGAQRNPMANQVTSGGRVTNVLTDEGKYGLYIDDDFQNRFGISGKEKNGYLNDMRQAVMQGDNFAPNEEIQRTWEQKQRYDRLNPFNESHPDWQQQAKRNIALNALAEISGVRPANKANQSYVRWFKENNPDWQRQAATFAEAYAQQLQSAKSANAQGRTFDSTAFQRLWA